MFSASPILERGIFIAAGTFVTRPRGANVMNRGGKVSCAYRDICLLPPRHFDVIIAADRRIESKNFSGDDKMSPIRKAMQTNDSAIWLALVRIFFGYIWLQAGIEKLVGGQFINGLAKTLGYFASKNPYIWQRDF